MKLKNGTGFLVNRDDDLYFGFTAAHVFGGPNVGAVELNLTILRAGIPKQLNSSVTHGLRNQLELHLMMGAKEGIQSQNGLR